MSAKHPIISVTGAGTSSAKHAFQQIFRRQHVNAAFVDGDGFLRYNRADMKAVMAREEAKGNGHFSHFGPDANLVDELEASFKQYGETGTCRTRSYAHDDIEAGQYGCAPGTFTPWADLPAGSDLLFYEGRHGAMAPPHGPDVARHADLKIGVVPIINLEWIQKLHRDRASRGHSTEDVTHTILRRMPDYVNYICPQFTHTDINFQRVPAVDTSNPFVAHNIPAPDETLVVIRFRQPQDIDFVYLLSMLHDSFMSRANSIVIPGGKLDLATQLILTPMILKLMSRKRRG
jgi:phosphoribulokinase